LHAWWGGLNERGVSEELTVHRSYRRWEGLEGREMAGCDSECRKVVGPVIEPLVSIKLRISCMGNKYRPKKDCGVRR
jgi:hypothetical protein